MENILKIIKSLENSGVTMKDVIIEDEAFFSMLLGTWGATLLEICWLGFREKVCKDESWFNGVYSRNNLLL